MKNKNLSKKKKKKTPFMVQRSNKELETKDNTTPTWEVSQSSTSCKVPPMLAVRSVVTTGWEGPDCKMQSIPFSGFLSYYALNNRFQVWLWK